MTQDPEMQALSRLEDLGKGLQLEEKFLSSSALGDNTMWIWSAFGRLQVDLFHYVKRSFSLPAYKLDYVCQHFMSGKLAGAEAEEGAATWFLKTKSTGDAVVGRYVFTPRIFHMIENTPRGAGGEIQLTDAIAALLGEETVIAYPFSGKRYDCGTKLGYLQATVEYALAHPKLKEPFLAYLQGLEPKDLVSD